MPCFVTVKINSTQKSKVWWGRNVKERKKEEVGLRQLTLAAIEDYAFMSYISEIATKAKQVFLVPYLPGLVVRAEGITASLAT